MSPEAVDFLSIWTVIRFASWSIASWKEMHEMLAVNTMKWDSGEKTKQNKKDSLFYPVTDFVSFHAVDYFFKCSRLKHFKLYFKTNYEEKV